MALATLLSHSYRDRILDRSEVTFLLIEHDPKNVDSLRAEVARFRATSSANSGAHQL